MLKEKTKIKGLQKLTIRDILPKTNEKIIYDFNTKLDTIEIKPFTDKKISFNYNFYKRIGNRLIQIGHTYLNEQEYNSWKEKFNRVKERKQN
jgi:hypothetical protein